MIFFNKLNSYCKDIEHKVYNMPNGKDKEHCLDLLKTFWYGDYK